MKTLNRALLAAGAAACAVVPAFGPALNAQADTLSQPLALEDVRHALTRTSFAAAHSKLDRRRDSVSPCVQRRRINLHQKLRHRPAPDTKPRRTPDHL